MKITQGALKNLLREAIGGNKIIKERPWSVEYTFKLSDGTAEDSEGVAPDGFAVSMTSEAGKLARIIVDTYWNPQAGDASGNALKFEVDGVVDAQTYVPVRFDDGKEQRLIVSNTPISGLISISHAAGSSKLPIVYLVVPNPFEESEDVDFDVEKLGNGKLDIELSNYTNL